MNSATSCLSQSVATCIVLLLVCPPMLISIAEHTSSIVRLDGLPMVGIYCTGGGKMERDLDPTMVDELPVVRIYCTGGKNGG